MYSYDKPEYDKMKMLLILDWETELAELNIQEAMGKLESILKKSVEECVPHRTITDTSIQTSMDGSIRSKKGEEEAQFLDQIPEHQG